MHTFVCQTEAKEIEIGSLLILHYQRLNATITEAEAKFISLFANYSFAQKTLRARIAIYCFLLISSFFLTAEVKQRRQKCPSCFVLCSLTDVAVNRSAVSWRKMFCICSDINVPRNEKNEQKMKNRHKTMCEQSKNKIA